MPTTIDTLAARTRTHDAPAAATSTSPSASADPSPSSAPAPTLSTTATPSSRADRPILAGTLVAVVAGLAVWLGVRPVDEQSAWLHMSIGRQLLTGGFGSPDPWVAHTAKPYAATEWLPGIASYVLEEAYGLPAIAWLRCAAILALLAALLWSTRRVADAVPATIAATAALVGSAHGLTARPQLLGLVFLALVVAAWWRSADDLRPRWWLVPMTWLWACTHGLWVVGVGVGFLTVAGLALDRRLSVRQALRLLLVPVLSLVAAAITPLGPALLLTPLTVGGDVREFVQEWQATSAHDPVAVVTLAMLGIVALALVRSRRAIPWWQTGHLALAFVATVSMERTIALGAILAAPLLAQTLQTSRGTKAVALTRRGAAAFLATWLAAAAIAIPITGVTATEPAGTPSGLSAQLRAIPVGATVLEDLNMGSWVEWTEPGLKPVMDSRAEIYSHEQHMDFARLLAAAPGWDTVLHRSGATYALVLSDSALAAALQEREHWSAVGTDAGYVLLKKA